MRKWNYDAHPFRPVRKVLHGANGEEREEQPDVWIDALGRTWYAQTPEEIAALPHDPTAELKVPEEFWHPDVRRKQSNAQHQARKREQEEERAEERRWAS